MPETLQPRDERDVCEAVTNAAASGAKLEIIGGGTKRGIGYPARQTQRLSMSALSRVIDYDPAELVLTVEPGALLADIETLLASSNQMLAFEPWESTPGRSTIGGVVGAGFAGSRRILSGGVRDHLLGFSAVNGRGEVFKAGGRVVKNVTGYDLPKLMAGSWGQLAILTQMTLKVLPRPSETRTLALRGLEPSAAGDVMGRAMRAPADVAAASYVPAQGGDTSITAIRLEGFGPSIEARARLLTALLRDVGNVDSMKSDQAEHHWRGVRSGSLLNATSTTPTSWRICVPPAQGAHTLTAIQKLEGTGLLDWAGGLVWARLPTNASEAIRKLAESAGGHAMLGDGPEDVRRAVPALHPEPAAVASLSRRVRQAFDPSAIFDPVRFEAPQS